MQSVLIVVNRNKTNAEIVAGEISRELAGRGARITVFATEGRHSPGTAPRGAWDIAFSLGGDGTVLYTARTFAGTGTPILPVHLGTLGFLAGVEKHEWLSVYESWLNNSARISERCMLSISVERAGRAPGSVFESICLNDVVVASLGIAKLIRLRADTEFANLGRYRADGLVIATPTGSTAYSMAAGGPILEPEMEALIISPICPFALSNRPLVLPSRQTLHITVEKEQRSGVLLTVDGQDILELEPEDTITISQSPYCARLITTGRSAYYSALKGKLAWGAENGGTRA